MIEALRQVLLAARAELGDAVTAEDIADAAWLARWLTAAPPTEPPQTRDEQPAPELQPEPPAPASPPKPRPAPLHADAPPEPHDGPLDPSAAAPVEALLPAAPGTGARAGRVFGARAAPALSNPLALARALRPLARRAPSRTRFTLDIDATVYRLADEGALIPVLRAAPERWLRLTLVADGGVGGELWRDAVREFRTVLANIGAFKDVRAWALDADGPEPRVGPLGAITGAANRHPDELLDPLGGTLTVVMSPFVAPGWRDGSAARALNRWATRGAVVLVPLLPDRLWSRTALGGATPVQVSAPAPGVANARLRWTRPRASVRRPERPDAPESERASKPVEVPVALPLMQLEPDSLGRWAAMLAGRPGAVAPGVLLTPPTAPKPRADARPAAEVPAEQRLSQFLLTSSAPAQRLAGLLAASPVSVKVLGVIRAKLLPEAALAHEAEVLFGGLLQRTSPRGESDPQFEFHPGVRELLLNAARPDDSLNVLEEVSEYLGEKFADGRTFRTVLADPTGTAGALSGEGGAFARIAADVLLRAGGVYAKLVRPAPRPAPIVSQDGLAESSQAPTRRVRPPAEPPPGPPEQTGPATRRAAALVIGISEYARSEFPELPAAAEDARAVAALLTDPDLCRFPPNSVCLLTDSAADSATISARLSEWLLEQARGAELVLIYYAGYGADGYLFGYDANLSVLLGLWRRPPGLDGDLYGYGAPSDAPAGGGLPFSDLVARIGALTAGSLLVCLDCHQDPTWRSGGTQVRSAVVAAAPRFGQSVRNRFFLTACGEGQQPLTVRGRHSLFAYHFLQGIRGAADRDGDRRVGVQELLEYVAESVARDARARGTDQTPWSSVVATEAVYISSIQARTEPKTPAFKEVERPPAEPLPGPPEQAGAPAGVPEAPEPEPDEYPVGYESAPDPDESRYRRAAALVIGIGQYAHPDLPPIPTACADAARVANVLGHPSGCRFFPHSITVLTDEVATRAAIDRHLWHWLAQEAHGAELVVLYFTGYSANGYLFTHDTDPHSPFASALSIGYLAECLNRLGGRAVLVCLDCHPDPRGVNRSTYRARKDLGRSADGDPRPRYLLASSKEEQPLLVVADGPYSLFAWHLLRGIAGAADRDGDGRVGATELCEYVSSAVARDARARGAEQTPWFVTPEAGNDIISAVAPGAEADPHTATELPIAAPAEYWDELPNRPEEPTPVPFEADPATAPNVGDVPEEFVPQEFGPYLLLGRLGFGGMGAVYRARPISGGPEVALKALHRRLAASPLAWQRFGREYEVLSRLRHPGVVSVLAFGQHDGTPYLTMELVPGNTLDAAPPRDRAEAVWLVRRVAEAVEHVHAAGIVHRDLKLSNIMVRPDGAPVVMDFGVAQTGDEEEEEESSGAQVGTLAYMSPEQLTLGPGAASPRSDVYALGAGLYKLLTGRLPFAGTTPELISLITQGRITPPIELVPGLDPRLNVAVLRALAHRPEDRFPSMAAFAEALAALEAPGAAREPRVPPVPNADPITIDSAELLQIAATLKRVLNRSRPVRMSAVHRELSKELGYVFNPKMFGSESTREFVRDNAAALGVVVRGAENEQEIDLFADPTPGAAPEPPAPLAADPQTIAPVDRFHHLPCVFGPYQLVELLWLGERGRFLVFGARDAQDRLVRVTVLREGADPERRRVFRDEAQVLRRLTARDLRCVPRLFDAGAIDGCEFFVTERLNGQRLDEYWTEHGSRLGLRELAALTARVARDMGAVHRAFAPDVLVHRNLNPRNILIVPEDTGEPPRIVVLGFGLSVVFRADGTSEAGYTGGAGGAFGYMPPEQMVPGWSAAALAPQADVYSLGVVLYRLLTGDLPYKAESTAQLIRALQTEQHVPPSKFDPRFVVFDPICRTALAQRPEDRHATMDEFARALTEVVVSGVFDQPSAPDPPADPFDREDVGDVTVVRIRDERLLAEERIRIVGDALLRLADVSGRKVVLNLSRLAFATGEFIGKLVRLHRKLQAENGAFVICGVAKDVLDVFAITKLDKIFTVARDEAEALRRLGSG